MADDGASVSARPVPPISEPPASRAAQSSAASRRGRPSDEPERDLWEDTYSPRAMIGMWIVLAVLTMVALAIGGFRLRDGWQWGILLMVVALAWLVAAGTLLYRRLGVRYRLTTQRLFHEKGLLRRTIDRIELFKMEDITCEQGLIERLLGIGSIRIKSSDRSDPDFWIRGIENVREVSRQIDKARRAEQLRRNLFIEAG